MPQSLAQPKILPDFGQISTDLWKALYVNFSTISLIWKYFLNLTALFRNKYLLDISYNILERIVVNVTFYHFQYYSQLVSVYGYLVLVDIFI